MDEAGHKTGPAACFEPAESERAATGGSPGGTGREVDSRKRIFWQTPASAGITDRKCLMSPAGTRVCGLMATEKVASAHALVAGSFGYRLPMVQSGAEQVLFDELWWVSGRTQSTTRWGKSRNLIPVRPEPVEGLIGPQ